MKHAIEASCWSTRSSGSHRRGLKMQQKWWIAAAIGLSIALAVVFFPAHDTGPNIPDANPDNASPLEFKGDGQPKRVVLGDGKNPINGRHLRPLDERMGPNPVAAEMMMGRQTPEAIHAGRLSGPWTVIRRQLMTGDIEEARAWGEGLAPLILDLRAMRRDPNSGDWSELETRQRAMLDDLKTHSTWLEDELTAQQLDRIEEIFTAYEEAKAKAAEAPTE